jgi:hypothetical protein
MQCPSTATADGWRATPGLSWRLEGTEEWGGEEGGTRSCSIALCVIDASALPLLRYLAAEVLKGRNTPPNLEKVDMFALGATLYELASGAPLPSSGDRWSALREGKVAMLPAVAQQLQNLIKVGP